MWFIILFAASGLGLQVAFDVARSGRNNILTRSGEEIRNSRLMSHFKRLTEQFSDGVLATFSLLAGFITLGVLWRIIRFLVHFL
jgi:hypothetical protein